MPPSECLTTSTLTRTGRWPGKRSGNSASNQAIERVRPSSKSLASTPAGSVTAPGTNSSGEPEPDATPLRRSADRDLEGVARTHTSPVWPKPQTRISSCSLVFVSPTGAGLR
jgi:hypothetical protein